MIKYHTRHIPAEHLDFDTETGRQVKENGLCDVLSPESLKQVKSHGIQTIELRLVWWEFEPEPGVFNWKRFDRDLELVENAGLKAGILMWLNHPPVWYHNQPEKAECFKCLEHGESTTTLSLWDPETLKIKERLMKIISNRYKDRLDFIYTMFSGDFGEPVLPQGVKHYKFSSPHTHEGIFWSGDKYARASWNKYIKEKYQTIDKVNQSWLSNFSSWNNDLLDEITDPTKVNTARRLDYMNWITESTTSYAANIYRLVKKYFPESRIGIPLGHCSEAENGQLKSLCIKKISSISKGFTVRWTGMAQLGEFGKSNILAARISSIARFYGVDFGEEAALIIRSDNAAAALYEGLSNGMSLLHNDIGNIRRADAINTELFDRMLVDPPVNRTALFYPVEQEMLDAFEAAPFEHLIYYIEKAAELRHKTNYDICDSIMIADGALRDKEELIFVDSTVIHENLLSVLSDFIASGGSIIVCNNAKVSIIENGSQLESRLESVSIKAGMPEYPEYEKLKLHEDDFITIHEKHISRFSPGENTFVIFNKDELI